MSAFQELSDIIVDMPQEFGGHMIALFGGKVMMRAAIAEAVGMLPGMIEHAARETLEEMRSAVKEASSPN